MNRLLLAPLVFALGCASSPRPAATLAALSPSPAGGAVCDVATAPAPRSATPSTADCPPDVERTNDIARASRESSTAVLQRWAPAGASVGEPSRITTKSFRR
jgi:hypothetical protein